MRLLGAIVTSLTCSIVGLAIGFEAGQAKRSQHASRYQPMCLRGEARLDPKSGHNIASCAEWGLAHYETLRGDVTIGGTTPGVSVRADGRRDPAYVFDADADTHLGRSATRIGGRYVDR